MNVWLQNTTDLHANPFHREQYISSVAVNMCRDKMNGHRVEPHASPVAY